MAEKRIFISYRRDDTAPYAGWLHELLAQRFGKPSVFKDVADVRPGMDFTRAITEAVASSNVLIVLIGPGWERATDDHGRRRLEDPKDWVRVEIEAALDKNLLVIPALLRGVRMPSADSLPPSLRRLTHMQAVEIDYSEFEEDVKRLVYAIEAGQQRTGSVDPMAARRERARADRFTEVHQLFRTRVEEQLLIGRRPWRQASSYRAQLDGLVDALDPEEEVVHLALTTVNDKARNDWAAQLQANVLGLVALTPRRLAHAPRLASRGVSFIPYSEIVDVKAGFLPGVSNSVTLTLPDRDVVLAYMKPRSAAGVFISYIQGRMTR